MAKWYHMPTTLRMSEREYSANVNGLNIVFGAVLGFVLAGAEAMPTSDFVLILALSASVVITILYLGSSEYRLFHAVLAITAVAALPFLLHNVFAAHPMPKLQPTIAV